MKRILKITIIICSSSVKNTIFLCFFYCWERETQRDRKGISGGEAEGEGDRVSEAGSVLTATSLMWASNSQTMSWAEVELSTKPPKCPYWHFDRDCINSVDCFGHYGHFSNIFSSNPWAWNVFPFVCCLQLLSPVFHSFPSIVFHLLS